MSNTAKPEPWHGMMPVDVELIDTEDHPIAFFGRRCRVDGREEKFIALSTDEPGRESAAPVITIEVERSRLVYKPLNPTPPTLDGVGRCITRWGIEESGGTTVRVSLFVKSLRTVVEPARPEQVDGEAEQ